MATQDAMTISTAATPKEVPPPLVDCVFGDGPLGIRIFSENGRPPVRIKNFYTASSSTENPVRDCGYVAPGMCIVAVQGKNVEHADYEDVLSLILRAKRPLTLRFKREGFHETDASTRQLEGTAKGEPAVVVRIDLTSKSPKKPPRRAFAMRNAGEMHLKKLRELKKKRESEASSKRDDGATTTTAGIMRNTWAQVMSHVRNRNKKTPAPKSTTPSDNNSKAIRGSGSKDEKRTQSSSSFSSSAPYPVPAPSRSEIFRQILLLQTSAASTSSSIVDRANLARHAFHSVPDFSELRRVSKDRSTLRRLSRATVWKILLDYLPTDTREWDEVERKKRENYRRFVEDFNLDDEKIRTEAIKQIVQNHELTHGTIVVSSASSTTVPTSERGGTPVNDSVVVSASKDAEIDDEGVCEDEAKRNAAKRCEKKTQLLSMLTTSGADEKGALRRATAATGNRNIFADEDEDADGGSAANGTASAASPETTPNGVTTTTTTTTTSSSSSTWRIATPEEIEAKRRRQRQQVEATKADAMATSASSPDSVATDEEMRSEVVKDVLRTMPGLAFFNTHRSNLERLLYLYSKLNPGISYVQGMNELLAPIYYVLAKDPSLASIADPKEREAAAEADAFWCFQALMNRVSELYTRELDVGGSAGISGCIAKFETLLEQKDPRLQAHLQASGVRSEFFAFRWLVTLNCREFQLPDVLCLWDALLADQQYFKNKGFIYDFCVAMLLVQRDALMSMCFTDLMSTLQKQQGDGGGCDGGGVGGGVDCGEHSGGDGTSSSSSSSGGGGVLSVRRTFSDIFECALSLRHGTYEGAPSNSSREKLNESISKVMGVMKAKWTRYRATQQQQKRERTVGS